MYLRLCATASLQAGFEGFAATRADPEFDTMIREYSATALPGMPPTVHNYDEYMAQENTTLFGIVARDLDDRLAGFAILRVIKSLHYAPTMGASESLFARPDFPEAGALLLDSLEKAAHMRGCHGLGVSLPTVERGAAKERMMRARGYLPLHQVFVKLCQK